MRLRRELGFLWGYGHYLVFAAAAAVGAGLEAATEYGIHHVEASATLLAGALAGAVSVYLVMVALVHGRLSPSHRPSLAQAVGGAVALFVIAFTVAESSLPLAVLLFACVVMVLVALGSRRVVRDAP